MTAKIFRNAFLIGFTVLLACILLFFFIMYSNYQAQAYDILEVEAEHIAEGMQICGGEEYLAAMQSDERITWIAPDGSVLYDNMADADTMENHLQRPEVQEAFETGSGRSDRYSSTILEKNNYYARLLKDGTVLRVAGKQTSVAAMALMLVQPSLWIVVLVLVLCGLLAMRLAKQIVRPINAINPDNPNATPTYPELQPLISRLQEQNRTIRTQLSELSTRQREFDAITENMREGFLIVDDKCNILSSNRSALRLLGIDGTPKPENLHQAVCSGELLTLVDAALDGTRGDEELSFGGGTWQLYANPVITGSRVTGAILIFMDVTEREQREALRREFSANVSHELKTPLTVILTNTELLQSPDYDTAQKQTFLSGIDAMAKQMRALVERLLELARAENEQASRAFTPCDLSQITESSALLFEAALFERGLTLQTELEPDITVSGDERQLSQLVEIYLDNARKYASGGTVAVRLFRCGKTRCRLSVSNEGEALSPQALRQIFDRFSRADAARTRDGSFGLGLSIAQAIAQAHGGSVWAESDGGVNTFFAELPVLSGHEKRQETAKKGI